MIVYVFMTSVRITAVQSARKAFYVISKDQIHDNVFVREVQNLVSDYLRSIPYQVKTMHEFTDGCSCQYKSRHCVKDLSTAASDLGYECLIRNFFETAHAKGPQDAAGGILKRQADIAILRGTARIQSAEDLFTFACNNLQTTKSSNMKRRIFRFVPEITRDDKSARNVTCVSNIRSVHQMINYKHGAVVLRPLSCYSCDNCLVTNNQSMAACTNLSETGQFREIVNFLLPATTDDSSNDDELVPTDIQSDLLSRNMVVAVATEDPDSDFYLMRITKEPYQLRKQQQDTWGCVYDQGTVVIGGYYYDKEGINYKLIKKRPALVPSCSVIYLLSDVLGEDVIHLRDEINLNILERLNQLKDEFSYE